MDEIAQFQSRQRRGRAAVTNPANRFDRLHAQAVDDGWARDDDLPPLRTTISEEKPRSVLTYNTSPDLPFDRSINPYRGCEHGCIYCFARPSHAYLGLSPGLDFETRLVARPSAPEVLAKELRAAGYKVRPIAIGTNTDPYQPIERDRKIMRGVLEVLRDFNHPVAIVTKGSLIERDIDILGPMAAQGLVRVGISVTSLDPATSRAMKPRAPAPARRLRAMSVLAGAGIPVRAMIAPVVPALTDHEMEAIMEAVKASGATSASFIVLRLPREVSVLFRDWLAERYPDRAARVMGRVRELHGGQDYDPAFGRRMTGQGEWAALLKRRFTVAAARLGLDAKQPPLRCDLFRPPPRAGDQLSLF
ncbi:MAG: PA0069 family radical SAM protein [Limimaricola sp.]|uniref:PA0069 family radical SAM protein n=1 Tax=Limimaricola sp. TaxID=2211665 RepID=UPI001D8A9E61|nr:PA0069 family radical SAM protein [Limimaricola sp.]MBI1416889.1 PA0069 family radical SAM protein [Limimaricola sp.]